MQDSEDGYLTGALPFEVFLRKSVLNFMTATLESIWFESI